MGEEIKECVQRVLKSWYNVKKDNDNNCDAKKTTTANENM